MTFQVITLKDTSCFVASETQQLIRNESPKDVIDGVKLSASEVEMAARHPSTSEEAFPSFYLIK